MGTAASCVPRPAHSTAAAAAHYTSSNRALCVQSLPSAKAETRAYLALSQPSLLLASPLQPMESTRVNLDSRLQPCPWCPLWLPLQCPVPKPEKRDSQKPVPGPAPCCLQQATLVVWRRPMQPAHSSPPCLIATQYGQCRVLRTGLAWESGLLAASVSGLSLKQSGYRSASPIPFPRASTEVGRPGCAESQGLKPCQ